VFRDPVANRHLGAQQLEISIHYCQIHLFPSRNQYVPIYKYAMCNIAQKCDHTNVKCHRKKRVLSSVSHAHFSIMQQASKEVRLPLIRQKDEPVKDIVD
jgi:hypothetical protein